IDLSGDPDSLRVSLNGSDVTSRIRDEDVTRVSSIVSTIPAVRRAMVSRQRELGRRGAVMNGRGIGSVGVPGAGLQFFLDADVADRAERRLAEEREINSDAHFEQTLADIAERDRRDTTREDSPLVVAKDAIVIDSTGLSIEEVFQKMMRYVRSREQTSGVL